VPPRGPLGHCSAGIEVRPRQRSRKRGPHRQTILPLALIGGWLAAYLTPI